MKEGQKFKVGNIVLVKFYVEDVGTPPSNPRDIGYIQQALMIEQQLPLKIIKADGDTFSSDGKDYFVYTVILKDEKEKIYDPDTEEEIEMCEVRFFQKELEFLKQPKIMNWKKEFEG